MPPADAGHNHIAACDEPHKLAEERLVAMLRAVPLGQVTIDAHLFVRGPRGYMCRERPNGHPLHTGSGSATAS